MPITQAQIIERTRRRLGGSHVCVELDDGDILECVNQAVDHVNRYVPADDTARLINASPSQKRYILTHRNLIGVTDVDFMRPSQPADRLTENPFLNQRIHNYDHVEDMAGAELMMYLTHTNELERVYSSKPIWEAEWEYNEETEKNEYALYVDLPEGYDAFTVTYRYVWNYDMSDRADTGLNALPAPLLQWVLDFTAARARELLGDIRAKFGGIPLPDSGTGEIDGNNQIDRGTRSAETLVEDLKRRQRPLPFIVG